MGLTQTPAPSRARQLCAASLLAVAILGLLGLTWGVVNLTVGKTVLQGEHDHDFGTVFMSRSNTPVGHRFLLRNTSSETLYVKDVRTTCGCTAAEVSTRTVEPYETLAVDTQLTLRNDGIRSARVNVIFDDDRVETLSLRAAGRMIQRIRVPAMNAPLEQGRMLTRAVQFADYDTNDEPGPLRVTAPPGVEYDFDPWRRQRSLERTRASPARWQTFIRLEQTVPTLPEGATIELLVDDQRFTLPIVPAKQPPDTS